MWKGNNLIGIYSFFQQVFNENLLNARNSSRYWGNSCEQCGQKFMPSWSIGFSEADIGNKQNKYIY